MKNFVRSRPAQIGLAAFTLLNFAHAGVMAQDASRAYFANDPVGRNLVTIRSEAPLETMLTRTSAIEASIKINPANVLDKPQARFVIDANTLDTGIALRNEHMKSEGWLDTAKYPQISFTLLKPVLSPGVQYNPVWATPGSKGAMRIEGELEFHGVKKLVQANVEVEVIAASEQTKEWLDGDLMHIKADFPLKLSDFGVNVPAPAQLKVANEQQVHVDVFVSTGSKAPVWAVPVAANLELSARTRTARLQTPVGPDLDLRRYIPLPKGASENPFEEHFSMGRRSPRSSRRRGTLPIGPPVANVVAPKMKIMSGGRVLVLTDDQGVETRFGIGPTF